MLFIYGLLTATGIIFVYDWVTGYPASDAVKDFFVSIFKKGVSFASVREKRLEAKLEALKAKL